MDRQGFCDLSQWASARPPTTRATSAQKDELPSQDIHTSSTTRERLPETLQLLWRARPPHHHLRCHVCNGCISPFCPPPPPSPRSPAPWATNPGCIGKRRLSPPPLASYRMQHSRVHHPIHASSASPGHPPTQSLSCSVVVWKRNSVHPHSVAQRAQPDRQCYRTWLESSPPHPYLPKHQGDQGGTLPPWGPSFPPSLVASPSSRPSTYPPRSFR